MGETWGSRKYSVSEIDDMRQSLRTIAEYTGAQPFSFVVNGGGFMGETPSDLEERLRTYMLNGTAPKALADEAERAEQSFWRLVQEEEDWLKRGEQNEMLRRVFTNA